MPPRNKRACAKVCISPFLKNNAINYRDRDASEPTHIAHANNDTVHNARPIIHRTTPAFALPSSGLSFLADIPRIRPIIAKIIPINANVPKNINTKLIIPKTSDATALPLLLFSICDAPYYIIIRIIYISLLKYSIQENCIKA